MFKLTRLFFWDTEFNQQIVPIPVIMSLLQDVRLL